MSEHIPSQSEDPLPLTEEYSYSYNKEPKSTLGEVVVTDPRDPFVWLQSEISKVHEMPSSNGKQLLWFIYRMNGNMPETDRDVKWRDDRADIESILSQISRTDMACVERYQQHLAQLDAEQALKDASQKQPVESTFDEKQVLPKLHEPNHELVLAAIMHHLDIVGANANEQ